MAFFRQLGLLMWKHFLLQRRKVCVSVFEIVLPLVVAILLVIARALVKYTDHNTPTFYPNFKVDAYNTTLANPKFGTELLYTPNATVINDLMLDVQADMRLQNVTDTVRGFRSEADMLDYFSFNAENLSFAVQFRNMSVNDNELPMNVQYEIRPRIKSSDDKWRTSNTFPLFQTGTPRKNGPDYKNSGFLWLQRMVDEAIIKSWNGSASAVLDTLDVRMNRMPYPTYVEDPMITVLQNLFPMILMLSLILCTVQTTKGIVYEKERKLKESMKLMGLSPAAHWTSWFLSTFIYTVIVMAIYTLMVSVNITGKGPALAKTDPSVFFVFLLCYAVAVISFCFMISVFSQKANVGAAIAGIVFFCSYIPYFFLQQQYETMSRGEKMAASILLNMAMAFGSNVIALLEGTGFGAQWNNINSPATVDDNFSLSDSMVMLIVDSVIYLFITWYVDNIYPGEFGVPKPFYFPFTRSYWCGLRQSKVNAKEVKHRDERHFEREPAGLTPGISIRNLSKTFGSGRRKKVAVKGTSLNMYEGQISVLLGHNGAGKTTTMSMLTGFIPPSSGTSIVNGFDIRNDIQSVRQSLGLCPQHDILFDTLTVEEHLEFFAHLKGSKRSEIKGEVEQMMQEVGLSLKRKTQTQHLSGGQKRKLSVGIALISGSKIVILDEPTSGMDPAARRQTWDILQRNRHGRTLLLTTHFMDEADLLGDRIAIMAEGVIKCSGTSHFLKKLYGAGYHMVMVKEPTCDVSKVTEVVQGHIPTANLESEINAEISYLLPDNESKNFAALFTDIENQSQKLGIASFGTTATTMEEVFLKVGDDEDEEEEEEVIVPEKKKFYGATSYINPALNTSGELKQTNGYASNPISTNGIETSPANTDFLAFNKGFKKETGFSLQLSRFEACFIKKALHTWRNRTITAVQLILPVMATIVALIVDKIGPANPGEIALQLDLSPFKGSFVPYQNGSPPTPMTGSLASLYVSELGAGNVPERIDLTKVYNVSEYFVTRANQLGVSTYNKKMIIAGEFTSDTEATAFYNGQPYHSAPTSLAYLMNAVLKYITSEDHSITTYNHPLPKNVSGASSQDLTSNLGLGFSIAINIVFGMAFLTSSFVYFIIKERQVGSKHLQVVSGVGPATFWMSTFAWDCINYIIPCIVLLPIFAAFQTAAYTEDNRIWLVLLVFVIYGWAVLPFMYLLQYLFRVPATGMVIVIVLNILTGLITLLSVFVLLLPSTGTEDVGNALDWVFSVVFPHYCLGRSFSEMYMNKMNTDMCVKFNYQIFCELGLPFPCCIETCGDNCIKFYSNYLNWETPGIGRFVFFMALQGAVYLMMILAVEYQIPRRIWYVIKPREETTADIYNLERLLPEDNDVSEEKQRIRQLSPTDPNKTDAIILQDLYKRFGSFVAVDHLSVGIAEKECFGLLGQNGAGKTTTFKMMTGDVMLTSGNAYLWSYDIKNHRQKVQANMGYCPQFDALIDQMTGRETLTMFAKLKGVPRRFIPGVCNRLLEIMMLTQYADKPTSEYSGGNKRKLSTAISLVGDPAFIMLDEPSTGMDPKARRQLWNVLSRVRECGRTLILTSHSMEECDALCTKIAIMVNGRFVCLGTPQHLKNKFGQGYTLIARMGILDDQQTTAPTEPLIQFIKSNYPHTLVFDDHQGYAHFQIPDASVRLAQVFTLMEQAKSSFCIEDYSVHQTTLEQVFLSFTRAQVAPREVATRIFNMCC